jgi:hypothetical protein
MLLLFLGGSAFALLSLFGARSQPLAGYLCFAFCGLLALVGAVGLSPESTYLELSKDGFMLCTLFRKRFIRWEDVEVFKVADLQGRVAVAWNYTPSYPHRTSFHKLNVGLAGIEDALPLTYGRSPADLAALLTTVHAAQLR